MYKSKCEDFTRTTFFQIVYMYFNLTSKLIVITTMNFSDSSFVFSLLLPYTDIICFWYTVSWCMVIDSICVYFFDFCLINWNPFYNGLFLYRNRI